jgi:hypothetical protein
MGPWGLIGVIKKSDAGNLNKLSFSCPVFSKACAKKRQTMVCFILFIYINWLADEPDRCWSIPNIYLKICLCDIG